MQIIAIVANVATAFLVVVFLWQTKILRDQIKYGYSPAISPRWTSKHGFKELGFQNVGNGSALNINIIVRDSNNKKLTEEPCVKGFAFTIDDGIRWTGINLTRHEYLNVEYCYEDILHKPYKIKRKEDISYVLGMPESQVENEPTLDRENSEPLT